MTTTPTSPRSSPSSAPRASQPPRLTRAAILAGALVASACTIPACSTTPAPLDDARVYPSQTPRAATLDIQVFRTGQEIEFTNTTSRAFGPSTLWLNGRYSRPIPGLAVGETLKFRLRDFRDEFSESFREGGFFATVRPDRLVLAELETADASGAPSMVGLVVVGTGNEE